MIDDSLPVNNWQWLTTAYLWTTGNDWRQPTCEQLAMMLRWRPTDGAHATSRTQSWCASNFCSSTQLPFSSLQRTRRNYWQNLYMAHENKKLAATTKVKVTKSSSSDYSHKVSVCKFETLTDYYVSLQIIVLITGFCISVDSMKSSWTCDLPTNNRILDSTWSPCFLLVIYV